jgi:hypothetical protein
MSFSWQLRAERFQNVRPMAIKSMQVCRPTAGYKAYNMMATYSGCRPMAGKSLQIYDFV